MPDCAPTVVGTGAGVYTNGNLRASVLSDGAVSFVRDSDATTLATVAAPVFGAPRGANASFASYTLNVTSGDAVERIYGMGEVEGLPKRESCDIGAYALPWARNGMTISLATAKFQVRGEEKLE